jgi:hypothetical protein
MVSAPQNGSDEKPLRIRRGRVESVDLYEIKDSELETFRRGSPADLQLNFAIFLLSISFSAIISLYTATFPNSNVHTTFIVIAVFGIMLGVYLLIAWLLNRQSLTDTCDQIRQRMKPDFVITQTTTSVTEISTTPQSPDQPKD